MKACTLGDRIFAQQFQKAVQQATVKEFAIQEAIPFYNTIIYAFANLPLESLILALLVDAHCAQSAEGADSVDNGELGRRDELSHAFLVRVMLRYGSIVDGSVKKELSSCDYHEHGSEEEKEHCQEKHAV